jgi:phage terminase large subunit-like protein
LDLEVEGTHCYRAGAALHHNSGKSESGAYCGAKLARFGPPNVKASYSRVDGHHISVKDRATSGWVVAKTHPMSIETVQPKYFDNGMVSPGAAVPMIPQREIKEWRQQDQILKLKNGSIIVFKTGESPAIRFAGAGKDWIHFDEEPNKEHFEEALIRVEAGRRLIVFGTMTLLPPIGQVGGVTWFYSEILKPYMAGELPNIKVVSASIYDNPFIGKDEIRMLESWYPMGSRQRRIRLDGEWLPGIGGSRAYGSFDRQLHVKSLDEMEGRRPLCWMWDFNVAPMVSVYGQRVGDVFKVHGELVLDEGSIPEMCEMFYNRCGDHRGEVWVYGDATGQNRTAQTAQSCYRIIANELRRYHIPFRMRIRPSNPLVADRLNAVNHALRDEFGVSRVDVDESCIDLIADFEEVLMDPRGGIYKSHKPSDPYYQRSHVSDAVGYWIAYEAPIKAPKSPDRPSILSMKEPAYGFANNEKG